MKRHTEFRKMLVTLLESGPKTTAEICTAIKTAFPLLCDDTIPFNCNGKRVCSKWNQQIRSIQQDLRRLKFIEKDITTGKWYKVSDEMRNAYNTAKAEFEALMKE